MHFLRWLGKAGLILLIVLAIAALVYFVLIRSRILRIGVSDEELKMPMPGDDLVESPNMQYMQAITINAPAEYAWAYLIQVGYRRAGWYNWDFINRGAAKDYFYENNRSADRVIPELQDLKEGDKIYLTPQLGMDVSDLKQNQSMLLTAKEGEKYIVSWSYLLKEVGKDSTKLYVRWHSRLSDDLMMKIMNLVLVEPGSAGIQQRQMFLGIKKRAEADYKKAQNK